MTNTTAELTWMIFILKDLRVLFDSTLTLYCDNISTVHMTINLVFYARSKHIKLDYHFVHKQVALGLLITQKIFTKPMSKATFINF